MATNEQLKLTIDIATRDAVKNLKSLSKEAQEAGVSAEQIADALDASTAAMVADLKGAESAANALGDALGPELRAKIGDAKIDAFVGDLRNAGLSFDEVAANADRFAASLKQMDAASDSVKNVDTKLQAMGHSADQSRSVLANMVGNSAQDLGELAGIGGSAGVMLGQLAEYAADGNIALGNLAKVVGPLAGVGIGVAALSAVMEENAKQQQFLRDQTARFAEALIKAREANHTATSGIVSDWEQSGKIEAQISNATATMVEFGKATDDMAKIHELKYPTAQKKVVDFAVEIDKLGMKAEDFATLSQQPIEAIQRWGAEMVANGADAAQVNLVMQGAVAIHERLAQAEITAAVNARVFGQAMADNTSTGNEYLATLAAVARVHDDVNAATIDAIGKQLGLEQSYRSMTSALLSANKAQGDSKMSASEQADATLSAKQAVLSYVQSLGKVPPQKLTEVLALIDAGNYNAALKLINELTKPRVVPISVRFGISGGNSPSGTLSPGQVATQAAADAADDFLTTWNQALANAPSGGGGGGGGGGASVVKKTADEMKKEWDSVVTNMFETGAMSEADYRAYFQRRLKDYTKFSDDWRSIWNVLHALDEKDAAAKKSAADAKAKAAEEKKKAAEEAKKAAEEAARKAQQAADDELQRQAMRAIVNANVLGASYANIYTAADPNAVVNAIQQWQRRNGPVPIKTTG